MGDVQYNLYEALEAESKSILCPEHGRLCRDARSMLSDKDEEIRRLREQVKQLKRMEAEAWGIRFCCNGEDCGCKGLPVDPPSWWRPDFDEEIDRLRSIIATLHDHADDCDMAGDCRCGRNQKLREVSGGD
jgi:hypothetical protein